MVMNKAVIGVILLVAVIGIAILVYYATLRSGPVPQRVEVWTAENVVVLDSTQTIGSPIAYFFKYDTGAFGYSAGMVALGQPSHDRAVLRSDHITDIEWSGADTLLVTLSVDDFELLAAQSENIRIVPRVQSN